MYITLEEYEGMYGPVDNTLFQRLAFDACRVMDRHTTGIDNVKKLRDYFPTDEADAQAVKHCAAKLVNLFQQIHEAETAAAMGRGYTETEQGMKGKVISSVTAGNESISFATGNSSATAIDAAAKDKTVRDKLVTDTVKEYLSGVSDANGMNLLFMGRYPRRYLC